MALEVIRPGHLAQHTTYHSLKISLMYHEVVDVSEIVLFGSELEAAQRLYPALISADIPVQRFFGDIARQILSNVFRLEETPT